VALFYALALLFWAAALGLVRHDALAALALLPLAGHFAWQVWRLRDLSPVNALALFRANRSAGLLMFLACAIAGLAP
jgi:4-hydroxybenzoate polyprenyltransferase